MATAGVRVVQGGYRGDSYTFNGETVVTVPADPEFDFGGAFMVSAAVRPSSDADDQTILDKSGDYRLALVQESGVLKARFEISTAAGAQSVISVVPVPVGSWTLLTGRYEDGRLWIGVGNASDYTVLSGTPIHPASELQIGPAFSGGLDEIRITDLSKGFLSTFANGQQSLTFTADATGSFSTTIRSTGQLGIDQRTATFYRGIPAEAMRFAQDDQTVSEAALSTSFTDLVTIIEGEAQASETTLGYVGYGILAYGAKFTSGIWGAGAADDPTVMAGDLVGGTVLGLITTPRDFINAAEKAVRLQANGWDAVAIVTALIGAATMVASKKVALIGKVSKLAKLIGQGDAAGPLARTLARETSALVADLGQARRIEKIAEVAADGSTEARAALKSVLDDVGDQGRHIDEVEDILKRADNVDEMTIAIREAQQNLSPADLRAFLGVLRCVEKAATVGAGPLAGADALTSVGFGPDWMSGHPLPFAIGAAATSKCEGLSVKACRGYAKAVRLLKDAGHTKHEAIMYTVRMGLNLTPSKAAAAMERLHDLSKATPEIEGLVLVVKDLGHTQKRTAAGAEFVLRRAHGVHINASSTGARLHRFEAVEDAIPGGGARRYDFIVREGTVEVRYELKRWTEFPPNPHALQGAMSQFLRDITLTHGPTPRFAIDQLRWVFPNAMPLADRPQLIKIFQQEISSARGKQALAKAGVPLGQIADSIKQLKARLGGGLIKFE
jgi:hypothetical protein